MTVHCEQSGGILKLILDRPEKRNALDDAMVDQLISGIASAGEDESVRAILISGAGADFCTGFDIVGRNSARDGVRPRVGSIQRRLPTHAHRLITTMTSTQVPIVAVVKGWAVGLGLHVVLAADFAVAAEDARFWEPFNERGFTPDSGGTWLLPRRVGERLAREMLMLGRQLDGTEAAEAGMIHAAYPSAELEERAAEIVEALAKGPTVGLGLTKWLLHSAASSSLETHLANEAFAMEISSRSEDFKEGLTAFSQKRRPDFKGR